MKKLISFLPVICAAWLINLILMPSFAYAHCDGIKHKDGHPHCGGTSPPPPPPGVGAAPKVVYRDGGIFLANVGGSNQTQIRLGGVQPMLDAPGERVLFYDYPSLGNLDYLGMIPYSINESGNISAGQEQVLVTDADTGGDFSSFGLTDWSQGGDKYAYTVRHGSGENIFTRIMVAPNGTGSPPSQHTIVWEGAANGGQGPAAWDASGDYIYLFEEFNQGLPQVLLVIDVRTNPGTVVKTVDLTPWIAGTGFAPDSNPQGISASYQTGGLNGSYSFDPGNVPARSDTSLCLMIPFADWSTRRDTRFTMIFDLPALFHGGSGVSCPIANTSSPIIDFDGSDFTAMDEGIVGQDTSKNRVLGVWVYEFGSPPTRTKIIGSGGFPDWSN